MEHVSDPNEGTRSQPSRGGRPSARHPRMKHPDLVETLPSQPVRETQSIQSNGSAKSSVGRQSTLLKPHVPPTKQDPTATSCSRYPVAPGGRIRPTMTINNLNSQPSSSQVSSHLPHLPFARVPTFRRPSLYPAGIRVLEVTDTLVYVTCDEVNNHPYLSGHALSPPGLHRGFSCQFDPSSSRSEAVVVAAVVNRMTGYLHQFLVKHNGETTIPIMTSSKPKATNANPFPSTSGNNCPGFIPSSALSQATFSSSSPFLPDYLANSQVDVKRDNVDLSDNANEWATQTAQCVVSTVLGRSVCSTTDSSPHSERQNSSGSSSGSPLSTSSHTSTLDASLGPSASLTTCTTSPPCSDANTTHHDEKHGITDSIGNLPSVIQFTDKLKPLVHDVSAKWHQALGVLETKDAIITSKLCPYPQSTAHPTSISPSSTSLVADLGDSATSSSSPRLTIPPDPTDPSSSTHDPDALPLLPSALPSSSLQASTPLYSGAIDINLINKLFRIVNRWLDREHTRVHLYSSSKGSNSTSTTSTLPTTSDHTPLVTHITTLLDKLALFWKSTVNHPLLLPSTPSLSLNPPPSSSPIPPSTQQQRPVSAPTPSSSASSSFTTVSHPPLGSTKFNTYLNHLADSEALVLLSPMTQSLLRIRSQRSKLSNVTATLHSVSHSRCHGDHFPTPLPIETTTNAVRETVISSTHATTKDGGRTITTDVKEGWDGLTRLTRSDTNDNVSKINNWMASDIVNRHRLTHLSQCKLGEWGIPSVLSSSPSLSPSPSPSPSPAPSPSASPAPASAPASTQSLSIPHHVSQNPSSSTKNTNTSRPLSPSISSGNQNDANVSSSFSSLPSTTRLAAGSLSITTVAGIQSKTPTLEDVVHDAFNTLSSTSLLSSSPSPRLPPSSSLPHASPTADDFILGGGAKGKGWNLLSSTSRTSTAPRTPPTASSLLQANQSMNETKRIPRTSTWRTRWVTSVDYDPSLSDTEQDTVMSSEDDNVTKRLGNFGSGVKMEDGPRGRYKRRSVEDNGDVVDSREIMSAYRDVLAARGARQWRSYVNDGNGRDARLLRMVMVAASSDITLKSDDVIMRREREERERLRERRNKGNVDVYRQGRMTWGSARQTDDIANNVKLLRMNTQSKTKDKISQVPLIDRRSHLQSNLVGGSHGDRRSVNLSGYTTMALSNNPGGMGPFWRYTRPMSPPP